MHDNTLFLHIEPLIRAAGAYLVDLKFRAQGRKRFLEVFADTEEGITAELLTELSRRIAREVDERGWITDSYQLIVSSPGLERPLKEPWQYRRHTGRRIVVTIPDNGNTREISGVLREASEEHALIDTGEGVQTLSFDSITHAVIQATLQDFDT
ncbi:MAG: hypothetical protein KFH87_01530 [Bacteroidetes bacterium]|nr:hypothetical protein [Bacteroidota bacterium]